MDTMKSTKRKRSSGARLHKVDMDAAYTEVEKMLFSLSWRYHQLYGIEFDECMSECNWAFVKALNWRYDPSKGTKFSSQVHTIANWRLRSLVRERTRAVPLLEINEETAGFAREDRSPCMEILDGLSEDARVIVALLLSTPADLKKEVRTPLQMLANVRDNLVRRGQMERDEFNRATEELRTQFRLAWSH